MKYKDIKCKDVKNCTYCPYGAGSLLKVCLSIKLDEELSLAYERIKENPNYKTKKIKELLEQEVKY